MKKRVVIGDPHGRWEPIDKIYNSERPDEVIVLGDYFDSFDIDAYTQRDTYEKLVELRKQHLNANKGQFILLIGNHDMHYMDENFGRCSGWNPLTCSIAGYPLCRDWDAGILQICYIDKTNSTIYSHAGVSMNWFDSWCNNNLDNINKLPTKAFCFTYRDGGDSYGSSVWNSPLWIRPESLKKFPFVEWVNGYAYSWSQVFGHTEPNAPYVWEDEGAQFYGIDCMARCYLLETLDDNGVIVNREIKNIS